MGELYAQIEHSFSYRLGWYFPTQSYFLLIFKMSRSK